MLALILFISQIQSFTQVLIGKTIGVAKLFFILVMALSNVNMSNLSQIVLYFSFIHLNLFMELIHIMAPQKLTVRSFTMIITFQNPLSINSTILTLTK